MRIRSMFHTLVALTVVLAFSTPSVTLAQQNSVQAEAITTAEQDAINDVNKLSWFVAGCAALSVGGPVGALAGYTVSNSAGTLIGGAAAGVLVPLIWIDTYEPNLPPNRFIGKSPEYIEFYTDAYRKQAKSLRNGSAMKGCIVGCIGVSLGGLVLFVQVLSESSFPYAF